MFYGNIQVSVKLVPQMHPFLRPLGKLNLGMQTYVSNPACSGRSIEYLLNALFLV